MMKRLVDIIMIVIGGGLGVYNASIAGTALTNGNIPQCFERCAVSIIAIGFTLLYINDMFREEKK